MGHILGWFFLAIFFILLICHPGRWGGQKRVRGRWGAQEAAEGRRRARGQAGAPRVLAEGRGARGAAGMLRDWSSHGSAILPVKN